MKPVPQVFGVRFRVVKSSSCTLVWVVSPGCAAWVRMLFSASFIAVTLSFVLTSCLSSGVPCVMPVRIFVFCVMGVFGCFVVGDINLVREEFKV